MMIRHSLEYTKRSNDMPCGGCGYTRERLPYDPKREMRNRRSYRRRMRNASNKKDWAVLPEKRK